MKNGSDCQSASTIIKGRIVQAAYRKPECPDHFGNPLIEALPPILTDDQVMIRLPYYPKYQEAQREEPAHIRYLLIQNGLKFFAPLDIHIDLQRRFSNLLRIGYAERNPIKNGFWKNLNARLDSFDQYCDQYEQQPDHLPSTAAGFNIIGPSGVGKSFSVERILSITPQIIHHSHYRGRDFTHSQLVWLKLDCPFDGNTRGLCLQFFKAVDSILGTNYYYDYTRKRLIQNALLLEMANVAASHFLGVLVIDEIQRLSLAKSGGADLMLNFFVQLINTIGVPVVLIGNYKALAVLSVDFSQMRRGTGQGDLIWDLMEKDKQWELFVESLWRFQYTKKRCSHKKRCGRLNKTDKSSKNSLTLSDVLYEETQGITDFAVKAYMFAQERAIDSGKEVVTAAIIRSAVKDKLRIPREVLQALKTKDKRVLERYEDLYSRLFKSYLYQQPEAGQDETHSIKPDEQSELAVTEDKNNTSPRGKKNTPRNGRKSPSSPSTRGELPELVAALEAKDGMGAYDALKQAGHIRSPSEYLTT